MVSSLRDGSPPLSRTNDSSLDARTLKTQRAERRGHGEPVVEARSLAG
jgi:hypothetical protein